MVFGVRVCITVFDEGVCVSFHGLGLLRSVLTGLSRLNFMRLTFGLPATRNRTFRLRLVLFLRSEDAVSSLGHSGTFRLPMIDI